MGTRHMTTTLYVSKLVCPVCGADMPDAQVEVFGRKRRATRFSPEEWPDIWVNEDSIRCEENGCVLDPAEVGMLEGRAIDSVVKLLEDASECGPYDTEQERDDDY